MIKNILIGVLAAFGVTCVVINIDIHTNNTLLKAEHEVLIQTLKNYSVAYSEQIGSLIELKNSNYQLVVSNRFLAHELARTKIEPPRNFRVVYPTYVTNTGTIKMTNIMNGKTFQWKLK